MALQVDFSMLDGQDVLDIAMQVEEEAKEHYERWVGITRDIGDRRGEASARANLGEVFSSLGRYAEAREHYEAGLAIAQEIGDLRGAGFSDVLGEKR